MFYFHLVFFGVFMKINIQQFLGVGYSTSIADQKRWKPSVEKGGLSKKIGNIGPIAPQLHSVNPITMSPNEALTQNEECLNLNIFTPGRDKNLPVMVWIHGGGFQSGSASLPEYDGTKLASVGNVVVVSINYRLACLGFLRLCDISNGDIPSTGNEGLGDQITALKWIQKNIHYFGGDKQNVTVFGESAGAMSIACLLASPVANTLFHKAILQSGAGHTYSSVEKANKVAAEFINSANQLGFTLDQLPSLSSDALLSIQAHFLARPDVYQKFGILPFTPVIERQLLPQPPHEAIAQGKAKHITLMAGTNTDEWTYFAALLQQNIASKEALNDSISQLVDANDIDKCLTQIDEQLNSRNRPINYQNQLSEMYCEFWFTQPCHRLLNNQIKAGGRAFRYKLGRRSPLEQFGCTHAADIGFVFNTADAHFHGQEPRVSQLVNEIQSSWAAFAHNDTPTTAENPWPSYDEDLRYMVFDHDHSYLAQNSPKPIDFWSRVSDQKLASF
jgi:para-nitrobenzyl esterase